MERVNGPVELNWSIHKALLAQNETLACTWLHVGFSDNTNKKLPKQRGVKWITDLQLTFFTIPSSKATIREYCPRNSVHRGPQPARGLIDSAFAGNTHTSPVRLCVVVVLCPSQHVKGSMAGIRNPESGTQNPEPRTETGTRHSKIGDVLRMLLILIALGRIFISTLGQDGWFRFQFLFHFRIRCFPCVPHLWTDSLVCSGFADKRRIQNSLCQLLVVLHWRNGQSFQHQKKKDHFRNVKTAAKGSRIAQVSGHLRASDLLSERFVLI